MSHPKLEFKAPEQLLAHLASRGMIFRDQTRALRQLSRVGYYRLAAYWYPFRRDVVDPSDQTDTFIDGTDFEEVHSFYIFDKDLRNFLNDPIERVEVAIRAALAEVIGKRDSVGHRNEKLMHWPKSNRLSFQKWLEQQDRHFARSNSDFAQHFRKKYSALHPPIWIAKEVWDWGLAAHLVNGLRGTLSDEVANYFSVSTGDLIGSWVKTLNTLRNDCAHHSRVWNRGYSLSPRLPGPGQVPELAHLQSLTPQQINRVYTQIVILLYLCKNLYPETRMHERLAEFIENRSPKSNLIGLKSAGFPEDWRSNIIWK